jgi:transcriptional regulator with XRE-family HTH domain
MARNQETQAFADRLKQALKRSAKKMGTPSELALQFNLRHPGSQVTNQAVQKWLSGNSRPTPDKIETLAALCNVSAQWLRHGIAEARPRAPQSLADRAGVEPLTAGEQVLLQRFRSLSAHQQELIADLLEQLSLNLEMWRDGGEGGQ